MRRLLTTAMALVCLISVACGKDPEVAKREHFARGNEYAAKKKYAEAVVEYRNAVQLDPRYAEARLRLAEMYTLTGQPLPALGEYVRAADVATGDAQAQIKAGEALLRARRFEDAQTRADKALAIAPKNTEALVLRANALAGLKKLDDAVAELEQAIAGDPDEGDSYANLGFL